MASSQYIRQLVFCGVIGIALLFSPTAYGQRAKELGLTLKATKSSSSANCEDIQPDQECVKYRMTFVNRGKEPLIIFNPTLGFGTGIRSIISFAVEENPESGVVRPIEIERRAAVRLQSEAETFKGMIPLLEDDSPPENLTKILQPGDEFSFEEMFAVTRRRKEYGFLIREGNLLYGCPGRRFVKCSLVTDHFRLEYEFPIPRSIIQDPDFLYRLAHRWRPYGRLVLDEDGRYTITSHPISRRI